MENDHTTVYSNVSEYTKVQQTNLGKTGKTRYGDYVKMRTEGAAQWWSANVCTQYTHKSHKEGTYYYHSKFYG
jgi:hypothetical protein